jgi:hypothetical protein
MHSDPEIPTHLSGKNMIQFFFFANKNIIQLLLWACEDHTIYMLPVLKWGVSSIYLILNLI